MQDPKHRGDDPEGGWLTRNRTGTLVLAVASGVAIYACFLVVRPLLSPLVWAVTLAVVAEPFHRWVRRRVRGASLAAAVAAGAVGLAVVVPAVVVSYQVVRQASVAAGAVHEGIETGRWREQLAGNPWLGRVAALAEQSFDVGAEADQLTQRLGPWLSSLLAGAAMAAFHLVVTLFALFFFLRDREHLLRAARAVIPLSDDETEYLITRVTDTVRATMYGNIATSVLWGVVGGLVFWGLGFPAPLLWGAAMFVLSLVPTVGAFGVWGPAALVLAFRGEWGKAVLEVAWGAGMVAVVDNFLYPYLVGKELRLHTLTLFVSFLGGVAVFGAVGLVLGPALFAATFTLLEIWRRRTAQGRSADEVVEPPPRALADERVTPSR